MTRPPGNSAARPPFWAAPALIGVSLVIAYASSFGGVFVFDDMGSIRENPTLRHLSTALFPPTGGLTVSGRPLLNLSFALNQLIGGDSVVGYHAVNLAIHFLATITLYGIARRTFLMPRLASRFGPHADWMALSIALLWGLHPLQTESVTYVVQRAESLAGLFYLLTLYCFARGAQAPGPTRWFDLAIAACILSALTKETAVTAPIVLLLYDRIFVSSSLTEAWDRRRGVYAGLAVSWLVVCWLVVGTGSRGGTAGFDTAVSWWSYALKQFEAVTLYLRLTLWPHPLVLDYGTGLETGGATLAIGIVVVVGLLVGTSLALWRRPMLGFLGAWFFLILAPTSSVVPVATQTMAEHRMYLPLAALAVLAVVGLKQFLGTRAFVASVLLAGLCGAATVARNRDYASWTVLWGQSISYGENMRAELNLGQALADSGHPAEAIPHYEAALRIQPHNPAAENNWANALVDLSRPAEALPHFTAALRFKPNFAEAHFNLANTLVRVGRLDEAVGQYRETIHLVPSHARAYFNLANALAQLNRLPEAVENYQLAVQRSPDNAEVHFHLGNALMQMHRPVDAAVEYEISLRLNPQNAECAHNLDLARQAAAQ